jgi:hypothetical protein
MFEWDAAKRDRNLARHRLDLTDAQLLFDGRPVVSTPSPPRRGAALRHYRPYRGEVLQRGLDRTGRGDPVDFVQESP